MIAQSSRPKPAIERSAPTGVGPLGGGVLESGTSTRAPAKPGDAIGTFTRKIDPHQNLGEQQATGDRADGDAQADGPAPGADGPGPLARGRERRR